jgi:tRNA(Ile)-lysidine synthase
MLLKRFHQHIKKDKLILPSHQLLVAVSGGIDSMVLLHLLHENGCKITVAHVNFRLRGKDSDLDEKCVISYCKKNKIPYFTKAFDTKKIATAQKLSIQEAARNIRYQWFSELINELGLDKIITAHHADDSIETLFINLFRGSGIMGLQGIPTINGKIVRPLLFASKNEIQDYAETHQINYREDKSNLKDDYLRNKIRHHLMAALNTHFGDKKMGILNSLNHLKSDANIVLERVKEVEKLIVNKEKKEVAINLKQLFGFPDYSSLLFYLLQPYQFNEQTVNDILTAIKSTTKTGKQFYSTSHCLLVNREVLLIKENEHKLQKNNNILITNKPQTYVIDELTLSTSIHLKEAINLMNGTVNQAFFDASKLKFPLTFRPWQNGDKFIPLGMKGFKKVSDFLIDKKVDNYTKKNVYALTDISNNIIWLANYRIDDRFKITETTTKVFCASIE